MKEKIQKLIEEAHISMEKSREMFGKEIYQKRFKPVYEGYLTALCTILEYDEDTRTEIIKGKNGNKWL